jgi:hypothetical protein
MWGMFLHYRSDPENRHQTGAGFVDQPSFIHFKNRFQ